MIRYKLFFMRAAVEAPRRRGRLAAGALLVLLAASCSKDDAAAGGPAGAHPLAFSAAVAEITTRSTTDNRWSGGEGVAVECGGTTKTYTAASDGALTAADPFYWSGGEGTAMTVQAWYCGDGSSAADGENATVPPAEWSVASDQSGEGFAQSDLLFAPPAELTYRKGTSVYPLSFYHQTAKVIVNIRKAEVVASSSDIRSVQFGAGNMALKGSFTPPADEGARQGTWQVTSSDGTVQPRPSAASADASEYVAGYSALVIPQTMDGKVLVRIEASNGMTYDYTPETGDAQFVGGRQYTYNVTLRADYIEVEVVRGGEWTQEGSQDNSSRIVYTADQLKPGDYFYSDGTTSDGGLRSLSNDGKQTIDWAVRPIEGKQPIGVVICTFADFPERFGRAEIQSVGGTDQILGMVMAAKKSNNLQQWCTTTVSDGLPDFSTEERIKADISGLEHCKEVWDINRSYSDYPAFQAACEWFEQIYKSPANTSGWFLPSAGQWWDIVYNLGGYPAFKTGVNGRISAWLQHIPNKDKIETSRNLYTSTQSEGKPWDIHVDLDEVTYQQIAPTTTREIRPILVFGKKNVK